MKKKIILVFLGLIFLLIVGVFVYVSMIDWNVHKERLSSQFSSMLGEKIEFVGDLKVSLFPHPKLSAKTVKIINQQTGEVVATADKVDMAVTLFSVLNGAPDIQSLSVDGAELWISFNEQGISNWHREQKEDYYGDGSEVSIQVLNVRNATVHLSNPTYHINADLTDFTAEIQAELLDSGPYQIAGNFMYDRERYGLALSIDSIRQFDDVGFQIRLLHPATDASLVYNGSYNKQTAAIKGKFSGELARAADTLNLFWKENTIAEKYNVPLLFSAEDMLIDDENVSFNNLAIKIEPFFVGTGDLKLPKRIFAPQKKVFDAKYKIIKADLRPLEDWVKEKFTQYKVEEYSPDSSWDGDFEFTAGQVVVSDNDLGVWQKVGAKGSWRDNILNIDDFYAQAADSVNVTASGNLAATTELPESEIYKTMSENNGISKPRAFVHLEVEGQGLRSLFDTLNIKIKAPTVKAYQSGKLAADIDLTPEVLAINNAALTLDGANYEGKMQAVFAAKRYLVQVEADKINLDNYILAPEDKNKNTAEILQNDIRKLAKLKGYNIDFKAKVDDMILRGVPMKNFEIDANYQNDELEILRFDVDELVDTKFEAAGVLKKLGQPQPEIEILTLNAKSRDFSEFAKKFAIPLPQWNVFKEKNLMVSSELSGSWPQLQIKTEIWLNGDMFLYDGKLQKKDDKYEFAGNAELKVQKVESVATKIAELGNKFKFLRGVFNGNAKVSGTFDNFKLDNFDFQLGPVKYTGNLEIGINDGVYSYKGDVTTNEVNFVQLLNAQKNKNPDAEVGGENTFVARPNLGKATFDFSAYKNLVLDIFLAADKGIYDDFSIDEFRAHVTNKDNMLYLGDISLRRKDCFVDGNLQVDYAQAPRAKGMLSFNRFPLKNIGGSVYDISGNVIRMTIYFNTSAISFEDMLKALSGKVLLKTYDITVKGIDLLTINIDLQAREYSKGFYQLVQHSLMNGETVFAPLNINIEVENGEAEFKDILLTNAKSNAVLNGTVNLKDWKLDTKIKVSQNDLLEIPAYEFSLSGALNNPALEISVEDIVRKYDEHWEKIAADEKAKKDEAERELNIRMSKAQEAVSIVAEKKTQTETLWDGYIDKKLVAINDAYYLQQKKRLYELESEIQDMENLKRKQDFGDNDITQIIRKSAELEKELADIKSNSEKYVADSLTNRLAQIKTEVVLYENEYAKTYTEFKQANEAARGKLRNINSERYIDESTAVQDNNEKMEKAYKKAQNLSKNFAEKYQKAENMPADENKLVMCDKLEKKASEIKQKSAYMVELQQNAADLLNNTVKQRQEAYMTEQLAKEKKRQQEAAENAGNLLIDEVKNDAYIINTSVPSKNVPEENKPENDKTINSGSSVLVPLKDGQNVSAENGGIIVRSYDGGIKEQKTRSYNVLRPITGKPKEAGGTIIVR